MKNKITVVRFIEIWFVILWVMFSVILISTFYLLSEQLELSLLRKNNRDNIQYYEENLLWTDSGFLVTDDERKLQNGYYVHLRRVSP